MNWKVKFKVICTLVVHSHCPQIHSVYAATKCNAFISPHQKFISCNVQAFELKLLKQKQLKSLKLNLLKSGQLSLLYSLKLEKN